jgi:hypothetical protein
VPYDSNLDNLKLLLKIQNERYRKYQKSQTENLCLLDSDQSKLNAYSFILMRLQACLAACMD